MPACACHVTCELYDFDLHYVMLCFLFVNLVIVYYFRILFLVVIVNFELYANDLLA